MARKNNEYQLYSKPDIVGWHRKDWARIRQQNCGGRLLFKREDNVMKRTEHLLSRITINPK
ncbi:MAG: hypothetical protein LC657_17800, partial [Desulfobacteraceae bacterium]|nr:hypothetical protein [Desulfobacteraceae bacterium]